MKDNVLLENWKYRALSRNYINSDARTFWHYATPITHGKVFLWRHNELLFTKSTKNFELNSISET